MGNDTYVYSSCSLNTNYSSKMNQTSLCFWKFDIWSETEDNGGVSNSLAYLILYFYWVESLLFWMSTRHLMMLWSVQWVGDMQPIDSGIYYPGFISRRCHVQPVETTDQPRVQHNTLGTNPEFQISPWSRSQHIRGILPTWCSLTLEMLIRTNSRKFLTRPQSTRGWPPTLEATYHWQQTSISGLHPPGSVHFMDLINKVFKVVSLTLYLGLAS